ncbi:MAG: hypothetical protein OXR66_06680 [Candidatus Woesearchaeota archaeon]|nr:hypothetical protein [Candidatus Woesearchaeota archaeon]
MVDTSLLRRQLDNLPNEPEAIRGYCALLLTASGDGRLPSIPERKRLPVVAEIHHYIRRQKFGGRQRKKVEQTLRYFRTHTVPRLMLGVRLELDDMKGVTYGNVWASCNALGSKIVSKRDRDWFFAHVPAAIRHFYAENEQTREFKRGMNDAAALLKKQFPNDEAREEVASKISSGNFDVSKTYIPPSRIVEAFID